MNTGDSRMENNILAMIKSRIDSSEEQILKTRHMKKRFMTNYSLANKYAQFSVKGFY